MFLAGKASSVFTLIVLVEEDLIIKKIFNELKKIFFFKNFKRFFFFLRKITYTLEILPIILVFKFVG